MNIADISSSSLLKIFWLLTSNLVFIPIAEKKLESSQAINPEPTIVIDFGISPSSGNISSLVQAFSCGALIGLVPVAITIFGAVNCSLFTSITLFETKEPTPL